MTKSLPSVTIVRRIKAPPAKIYAALTQPKLMMQWWGPDAGPTLSAEADVRPGGRFSIISPLAERRGAQSHWDLSGSGSGEEACFHLGMARNAGTGVAGHVSA